MTSYLNGESLRIARRFSASTREMLSPEFREINTERSFDGDVTGGVRTTLCEARIPRADRSAKKPRRVFRHIMEPSLVS